MNDYNFSDGEKVIIKTQRNFLAVIPVLLLVLILIGVSIGLFAGLIKVNEYIAEVKFDYYEVAIILIDIVRYAALICSIFFGALGVILRIAKMKVEYFMLTDRRIYGTQGLFTKKTLDIMLDKVDTIRINSTLFGRLLKYYTIEVISPSSSRMIQGTTVNPTLHFVKNAEEFRTKVITTIDELKAKEKQS